MMDIFKSIIDTPSKRRDKIFGKFKDFVNQIDESAEIKKDA